VTIIKNYESGFGSRDVITMKMLSHRISRGLNIEANAFPYRTITAL